MARTKQTARMCYGGRRASYSNQSNSQSEEQAENQDDTNQFVVKFDDQQECETKAIQENYIQCKKCQAILTSQNYIYTNKQYTQLKKQSLKVKMEEEGVDQIKDQNFLNTKQNVWICQFCRYHTIITKDLKICNLENPCYLIQKSTEVGGNRKKDDNEQMLIFCIDVSGSMSTFVSKKTRLQSVKEAIVDELKKMKLQKSKKRVGIITFGTQVHILGDGNKKYQILQNRIYDNFQSIVQQSHKYLDLFQLNISKSYQILKKIVDQITTRDSTALGPALLCAVQIASTASIGSKVIICTDGQANCGLGSNYDPKFYDQIASYAKQKRVGVNILSIKGDNCNLKLLGKVALSTNGELLKVDPQKLGTQFSKIITDEIIGSNAQIFIRLNKRFKFRKVDNKLLSDNGSVLKDNYGNFTKENQITYQFDLIQIDDAKKIPEINLNLYKQKKLPMQIQIKYISKNKNKYLQVFTDWRQITLDQQQIFSNANFNIFASNIIQKLSNLIKQEKYEEGKKLIQKYRTVCIQKFAKIKENQIKIKNSDERIKVLSKVLNSKELKKKNLNSTNIIGRRKRVLGKHSDEEDQQQQEQDQQEQDQQQDQQSIPQNKRKLRSRSRDTKSKQKKQLKSRKTQSKKKQKAKKATEKEIMSSDQQQKILLKQMRAKTKQIQQ